MSESETDAVYYMSVCPEGHVHIPVDTDELILTPDHARVWIKHLYEAMQEAEQA